MVEKSGKNLSEFGVTMPRYSMVHCDCSKDCKVILKVGESDSSPEVFEMLHLIDATGNDWWFANKEHLEFWLESYESPYASKENVPLTAMLPEEDEEEERLN